MAGSRTGSEPTGQGSTTSLHATSPARRRRRARRSASHASWRGRDADVLDRDVAVSGDRAYDEIDAENMSSTGADRGAPTRSSLGVCIGLARRRRTASTREIDFAERRVRGASTSTACGGRLRRVIGRHGRRAAEARPSHGRTRSRSRTEVGRDRAAGWRTAPQTNCEPDRSAPRDEPALPGRRHEEAASTSVLSSDGLDEREAVVPSLREPGARTERDRSRAARSPAADDVPNTTRPPSAARRGERRAPSAHRLAGPSAAFDT